MNRFYITSDWHLDAVTAGVKRFSEVADTVETLLRKAEGDGAGFVFGGDLCDPGALDSHRCTGFAVHLATSYLAPKLWLTGNHDIVEDGHQTTTLDPVRATGAVVIAQPDGPIQFGDFMVGALPYTAKTHPYDTAKEVADWRDECDVVLGHLDKAGLTPGSEGEMLKGRRLEWPMDALEKHQPQATLIGGHYHRGQQVGNLHIVGAPVRFNFGEQDHEPSYLSVELVKGRGKKRQVKVERHLFENVRRVYSMAVDKPVLTWPGDIVRILYENNAMMVDELEHELLANGAAAVRTKACTSADQVTAELIDRPEHQVATAEDGFKAAARLAREWPAAEQVFNEQLEQLVVQLGEQSR